MSYSPNIPEAEASPQNSASPIQQNFSSYAAAFSVLTGGVYYNHMPINDQNGGKHAAILLDNQSSAPGVTQDLDVLFSMNAISAASTQPQLFVQIPQFLPTPIDTSIAPNTPMQLTYNSVNTSGPQYQSFLPGGYLLYFGLISSLSGLGTTITLSPTPTKILMVQSFAAALDGGAAPAPWVTIAQPGMFTVFSTIGLAKPFYYMAIAQA
jgi:hypothetical protein